MNEGKMKLIYEMSDDSDSIVDNEPDDQMETQNTISLPKTKRRSYVWKYFSPVPDHLEVYRCRICSETFGNKTANLGRHLQTVHGVTDVQAEDSVKKGRPNRSIVWNFCTKLDHKRALCHLCKKVLYFGGGNTSNITKHLKRMHAEKIEEVANLMPSPRWGPKSAGNKKERKGSSYVWNYCEKLSKNTVLCKLCKRKMRFHGTANVITHLQRRHDIMDETTTVKLESPDNIQEVATSSTIDTPMPRRSSVSGSLVWKYIIRLSEETVRCRVCLKNLSYQGTSNLQRHLHRMHNIMWNVQDHNSVPIKIEPGQKDTFLDFCEQTSNPSIWKCQMCEEHFSDNGKIEECISRHMIKIHGAAMRGEPEEELPPQEDDGQHLDNLYSNVDGEEDTAIVESDGEQMEMSLPESDEALYNDIIEVEEDLSEMVEVEQQLLDSVTGENTPSQQSGENVYSDLSNDSVDAQLVTTTIQADDTPVMRELKEDLLRQQVMYFSEKAGFYRMQKCLVAHQVRKERLEIEKLLAIDGKGGESAHMQ